MKYKKSIIITMLVIFIFAVAAASASDVNETAVAIGDGSQMGLSQSIEVETDNLQTGGEQIVTQTDNDEISSASNDSNVLGNNPGTYSQLANEIGKNGNIELQHDYYSYGGQVDTIHINEHNKVIDGKGAVIDMAGSNIGALYITGNKVIIKNLTIKNVNYHNVGGAMYFINSGTVENCTFINCTSMSSGGAIFFSDRGTVTNCNFVDNHAISDDGGGGAIFFSDRGTVVNCNFVDNYASGNNACGGAVWMYSGSVENCNFTNNFATELGGAVYFNILASVTKCNFTNNKVTDVYGSHGGAVSIENGGNVTDCSFTYNVAFGKGGAVDINNEGTVENCKFVANIGFNGGAVGFGSGNVTNCNFSDNQGDFGGAIYVTYGTVANCNFVNSAGEYGGSIYFHYTSNVVNCTFKDGVASQQGGAILFNYGGNVTNCNFTNNSATGDWGGAILIFGFLPDISVVKNCNFYNNSALYNGGAVAARGYMNTLINCTFVNNTIFDDGNSYYNKVGGGAVYFDAVSEVMGCNFVNNAATNYHGGAVYFNNDGNATDSNFTNNKAPDKGGALYWNGGNSRVSGCVFVNNSAVDYAAVSLSPGVSVVFECVFVNNSASGDGVVGAGWDSFKSMNIANNIFLNNHVAMSVINTTCLANLTADYNWFGNTADDYGAGVASPSSNVWLFLNATANPETVPVFDSSLVNFKLYAYDASGKIFEYDNALLKPVDLAVTSTNGNVNESVVGLGKSVKYTANAAGTGSVTAEIENVSYTIELNNAKISPELSAQCQSVIYGENATVTLTYNSNAGGTVNITLAGKKGNISYRNLDLNTSVILSADIPAGEYNITVYYSGDGIFQNATANATLTVNRADSALTINNITFDYNKTGSATIAFTNASSVNAFVVGHDEAIVNVSDNTITVSGLDAGNYTLSVTTIPDANHNNITKTAKITVNRVDAILAVDDIVFDYNTTGFANVSYMGATGVNATVVGQPNANVTVDMNTIAVSNLNAGNYTLSVIAVADVNHNDVTKTVNITVNRVDVILAVDDIVFDYNTTGFANVSYVGATCVNASVVGQPDAVVNVTDGVITVCGLDAGTYTLSVAAIADGNHNNITKNATITVNKLKTQLTAKAVTATYNINKDLVITLNDSTGKALSGVKVTVDLKGSKEYTTDKNGQVKVSTKGLAPKTYTAKVTFNGNTNFDKSTKDVKVTVKKATPKITAKKKTFKAKTKTKKYTITLKDNTGKPIKNAKVTLIVKGKTYKAKTNSKGKATFKITKLKKKGTYKATVTYKGNKYYKKATKKVKITVKAKTKKSTFKTVSKGSKDAKTVKKIQRALKDNGYYLTYQGHYLKVDGKYDSCTVRSVKEFQSDKGLKVTGKVDQKTAKKLGII